LSALIDRHMVVVHNESNVSTDGAIIHDLTITIHDALYNIRRITYIMNNE